MAIGANIDRPVWLLESDAETRRALEHYLWIALGVELLVLEDLASTTRPSPKVIIVGDDPSTADGTGRQCGMARAMHPDASIIVLWSAARPGKLSGATNLLKSPLDGQALVDAIVTNLHQRR